MSRARRQAAASLLKLQVATGPVTTPPPPLPSLLLPLLLPLPVSLLYTPSLPPQVRARETAAARRVVQTALVLAGLRARAAARAAATRALETASAGTEVRAWGQRRSRSCHYKRGTQFGNT